MVKGLKAPVAAFAELQASGAHNAHAIFLISGFDLPEWKGAASE
jgi:hypothetical protein